MSKIIAPSLLSANFANLSQDITLLNQSAATWLHVDVMDGVFVPNISFGFPVFKAIRSLTDRFLDVHLMITEPQRYLEAFAKAGADQLTVHWENQWHLHRTLQQIRLLGKKTGLAINPHTSVAVVREVIGLVDTICLMGVNPGFGGQSLIPQTWERLDQLALLTQGTCVKIQIDGGVSAENAGEFFSRGAEILVAGQAVFHTPDILRNIEILLASQ